MSRRTSRVPSRLAARARRRSMVVQIRRMSKAAGRRADELHELRDKTESCVESCSSARSITVAVRRTWKARFRSPISAAGMPERFRPTRFKPRARPGAPSVMTNGRQSWFMRARREQCVTSDAAELMDRHGAGNESAVADAQRAAEQRAVHDHHVVADRAVVSDVAVGHEKAVASDSRVGIRDAASMYGHAFTDEIVLADRDEASGTP